MAEAEIIDLAGRRARSLSTEAELVIESAVPEILLSCQTEAAALAAMRALARSLVDRHVAIEDVVQMARLVIRCMTEFGGI
jgi:hypothetical protein